MNHLIYLAFSLAPQTPSWILWSAFALILVLGGGAGVLSAFLLRDEARIRSKRDTETPPRDSL
ncbi:MAG: hypothetical protein J6C26_09395 [Clostridia bacterium]|nr:hypothetical protein [Clostridia bacterium]